MLTGASALLILAIVLIAGTVGGFVAIRLHLPAVTGQILIGVALGPSALGLFEVASVDDLQPITHFALGLIAVAVGNHLHIRRLRNTAKRLMILLLFEATLTPLLVFIAVTVTGATWEMALLLAALAVSTAPATIFAIVKETRSKGVFVKTLVPAVALNNIACICLFAASYAAARVGLDPEGGHALKQILWAPFRQLAASAALGGLTGAALVGATWRVVRADHLATASMIAILLTAGLADYFEVSSLLACLFLGVTLANLTPNKEEIGHTVFENFERAILTAFFTLAGLVLDLENVVAGGLLAAAAFGARVLGKVYAVRFSMHIARATEGVRKYLGMALVPQAGVAVGLMLLVKEDPVFASISDLFLAIGLTVVTASEVVGPIFTRMALAWSGEEGKDRARLIDFIHEENILADFKAETKEEAIRKLTDLLVRSHHLSLDRGAFYKRVMDREEQFSTCVGGGLMIPHGVFEGGDKMVGVMGLSRNGFPFETPDGVSVHCIVLLATPPAQRARHLEVLAALARAIGSDPNVQQQLFNATSAAHAYEILHAEEFEDVNYFLDER